MESLADSTPPEHVEAPGFAHDDQPRTHEGRVVGGKREGPFRFHYRSGQPMAECSYTDGLKHGSFVFYYPNGAIERSGGYLDGRLSGPVTHYHENGRPADERCYQDGLLHGPRKTYHADGRTECEECFADGKLDGPRLYFSPEGQCLREERYVAGKRHGEAKSFSPGGRLIVLERFEDGLLEGAREQYFEDGKPYIKSEYVRGKLHGIVQRFDEEGNLVEKAVFRRGQLMKVPLPETEEPREQQKRKTGAKPKKHHPRLLMEHPADLALAAQNTGMAYVEAFAKNGGKLLVFVLLPGYLLYLIGQSILDSVSDKTKERLKLAFEYSQRGEMDKAMEGIKTAFNAPREPEAQDATRRGPQPAKQASRGDFDVKPSPAAAPSPPPAAVPPRNAPRQQAPAMDVIPVLGKGNSSATSTGDRLARALEGQPDANVPLQYAPAPPAAAQAQAAARAVLPQAQSAIALPAAAGAREPEPLRAAARQAGPRSAPPAAQQAATKELETQARAAYMAGAELLRGGSPHEAIEKLGAGISAKPDFAEAHVLLAVAHARLGKTIESFRAVRQAVTLKPSYDVANAALGAILLSVGRESQAAAYLEKTKELSPALAEPRALLGIAYMRMGRWDDARTELEVAINANHRNSIAWAALAAIHWKESRKELAVSELTRALAIDPREAGLGLWDFYSPIKSGSWSRDAALRAFKTLLGSELARGIDALESMAVPQPCKEDECFD